MFRKIVSNLSFSSALVGQLAFYAKRLRREEATRRMGLIFVVLALIVQGLVVFNPPQPANAATSNDLVYGGLGLGSARSINNFLAPYDANTNHLHDIMDYMGISRQDIVNTTYSSFLTTSSTLSWGHNAKYSVAQGESPVNITPASGDAFTIYHRPLTLSNGSGVRIYAYIGHSPTVGWFALMQACGNLVTMTIPPPPAPKCTVAGKTDLLASDTNCFVNCTIVGKTSIPATSDQCFAPCPLPGKSDIAANSTKCTTPPCPYPGLAGVAANSIDCKQLTPANLVLSKSALNMTQGNVDATTVTAKASDQIRYTITVQNTGGTPTTAHFTDSLVDAMDYATLTDNGGGTFDTTTQALSWPDVTLGAGESQSRSFVIRLMDTIASTPQGESDPTSYDCQIMNVFGNQTDVKVDCPAPKVVEQTVTQLPHTGPTDNMLFAGIVLAIVAYFYLRSRQVGKEVRLIRRDLNAGTI